MPKVTLQNVENLQNEQSAVGRINANFQALQSVIDTLLSRDGATPNQMVALLDMNNRRIINLPPPVSAQEPARHGDIQQYVDQAQAHAEYAEEQADRAENEADRSETQADRSEELLHEFQNTYLGAHSDDPLLDENGQVPPEGAIYLNTSVNQWRVFVHLSVLVNQDYVEVGADRVEIHYWMDLPQTTLRSLADVAADVITPGQYLIWDGSNFIPFSLTADDLPYNGGVDLSADNVQDAIDELIDRTSLAVYDISFYAGGLMENNERVFRLVASRQFNIPVGAPGSVAAARIAANAETVVSLQKNGVQFGTVTFAASGTSGTFSVPGTTVFNPGDVLEIRAPNPADTLLRDTAITLACRR